jgi:hypothetical protein
VPRVAELSVSSSSGKPCAATTAVPSGVDTLVHLPPLHVGHYQMGRLAAAPVSVPPPSSRALPRT